jgi:hypothetical protein
MPDRVSFDDTVTTMQAVGCHTIKAELQPNDPPLGGQRAQFYSTDSVLGLPQYGAQPSLDTNRGSYRWYAFAFTTNPGYRPQSSQRWPDWNVIYSWHDSCDPTCAPQANIGVDVSTATLNPDGSYTYLPSPKLSIDVLGGSTDPSLLEQHHWYTVDFVPGQRYVVQMGVKWGDNHDGSIEVWINGQQVVPATTVSDVWQGMGVYPVFENYRQANDPNHPAVTWTNTVYYAGLVRGARRSDVRMPVR